MCLISGTFTCRTDVLNGCGLPEGSSRFYCSVLMGTRQSDSHKHEGCVSSAGGGSSQSCWCIRWTVIHTSCFVLTPSSPPLPSPIWSVHRSSTCSIFISILHPWKAAELLPSLSGVTFVSTCGKLLRKCRSRYPPPGGGREQISSTSCSCDKLAANVLKSDLSGPSDVSAPQSSLSDPVCNGNLRCLFTRSVYCPVTASRLNRRARQVITMLLHSLMSNTNIIHICSRQRGLQTSDSIHHGALTGIQQPLISC